MPSEPNSLLDGGPPCSQHPEAPHGFNRSRSHSYDRYSCDCEHWSPADVDDNVDVSVTSDVISDVMSNTATGAPIFQAHSETATTSSDPLSHLSEMHRLLTWNRSQPKPPIAIGMEYEVAKVAIEMYRQLKSEAPARPLLQPFALVRDRSFDGEGFSLAVHDGYEYQFSDGDCFAREGNTLDGRAAQFLTQHQVEQRLATSSELHNGLCSELQRIRSAIDQSNADLQTALKIERLFVDQQMEEQAENIEGWWVGFPDGSSRVYGADYPIQEFSRAGAVCKALGFVERLTDPSKEVK